MKNVLFLAALAGVALTAPVSEPSAAEKQPAVSKTAPAPTRQNVSVRIPGWNTGDREDRVKKIARDDGAKDIFCIWTMETRCDIDLTAGAIEKIKAIEGVSVDAPEPAAEQAVKEDLRPELQIEDFDDIIGDIFARPE